MRQIVVSSKFSDSVTAALSSFPTSLASPVAPRLRVPAERPLGVPERIPVDSFSPNLALSEIAGWSDPGDQTRVCIGDRLVRIQFKDLKCNLLLSILPRLTVKEFRLVGSFPRISRYRLALFFRGVQQIVRGRGRAVLEGIRRFVAFYLQCLLFVERIADLQCYRDKFGFRILRTRDTSVLLDFCGFGHTFSLIPDRQAVYIAARSSDIRLTWALDDSECIPRILDSIQRHLVSVKMKAVRTFLEKIVGGTGFSVANEDSALNVRLHRVLIISISVHPRLGTYQFTPNREDGLIQAIRDLDLSKAARALRELREKHRKCGLYHDRLGAFCEDLAARRVSFLRISNSVVFGLFPFDRIGLKIHQSHWRLMIRHTVTNLTLISHYFPLRFSLRIFECLGTIRQLLEIAFTAKGWLPSEIKSFAVTDPLSLYFFDTRSLFLLEMTNLSFLGTTHSMSFYKIQNSMPAISMTNLFVPMDFRKYFSRPLSRGELPDVFVLSIKCLKPCLNYFYDLFIRSETLWSVCMLSLDRSFHLIHRSKFCINVIFLPPDLFQFIVPPFGPSAILILPLSSFPQFRKMSGPRSDDPEHIPHPSAKFKLSELSEVKSRIENVLLERHMLATARFANFRPGGNKTSVVPTAPQMVAWISLTASLTGMGITLDVADSPEAAARTVKYFSLLEIPDRTIKMNVYRFLFQLLDPAVRITKVLFEFFYEIISTEELNGAVNWPRTLVSGSVDRERIQFTLILNNTEYLMKLPREQREMSDPIVQVNEQGHATSISKRLRSELPNWLLKVKGSGPHCHPCGHR
jgi:hypothetical protein